MESPVFDIAYFICESDLIEGIRDDPALLKRQINAQKKDGYVGAMLKLERLTQSLLNTDSQISEGLICEMQGLITNEQHQKIGGQKLEEKYIGRFRDCQVYVGGRQCPRPNLVPGMMASLLRQTKRWQENSGLQPTTDKIKYVADFHFRFLVIHPFADGNGRTARALAYYMLRWSGLKPFVFTSHDKHELYYPCFDNPEDPEQMRSYFFRKMSQPAR